MDSSSHNQQHHQNWLAFSLSNPHHFPSSHLSLFHSFHPNPGVGGGVIRAEENVTSNGDGATTRADLSTVLTSGSPKLEDFLGGANGSVTTGGGASADVCHHQLSAPETSSALVSTEDMYNSELKSIAASFLQGYYADPMALVPEPPLEPPPATKKPAESFGQRTSIYRGVTRHRWTGRYEAHLWDNTCRREGQSRKGRQVYLGGYDKEDKAARAYDLAALKYWGPTTTTNFPVFNYEKEIKDMKQMTRQEFVASLRRKSSGFSRGASIYRGVTRHHQQGRWQARIGRVAGNKDLYLGTFSTQEEAAEAYDIAAIKFRGLNAVTNFDTSRYDVKSIASSNLPIGGLMTNKSKTSSDSLSYNKSPDTNSRPSENDHDHHTTAATSVSLGMSQPSTTSSALSFGLPGKQDTSDFWYGADKNPSAVATLQSITTPFSSVACENNNGYFNSTGGGTNGCGNSFDQEQNNGTTSNNGSTYEGTTNYGNWITPSMHSFQPAKQNLSGWNE